jgi:hypothetical protein
MKVIAIIVASFWLAGAAMAQSAGATAGATCKTDAQSLHGAALSSKLKKCCRDAAVSQKLHGAAETGFRKACEQAALGS